MSLLDPKERSQRGEALQAKLTGRASPEPETLYQSSWRDYIFAEIWERPGLDLRSRFLISIASAAESGQRSEQLDGYVRGALKNEALTQLELREVALHSAIYGGWDSGAAIDEAITRVEQELGLERQNFEPVRAQAWDPEQRLKDGAKGFHDVMTFGGPPPIAPYFTNGILNFVFGET